MIVNNGLNSERISEAENRPHTPSLLWEMRTRVRVFVFCYFEAVGTLVWHDHCAQ